MTKVDGDIRADKVTVANLGQFIALAIGNELNVKVDDHIDDGEPLVRCYIGSQKFIIMISEAGF